MRIFLLGFMGSGKSSIGKRLAAHLNLEFIDLDSYMEERFKMSVTNIFAQFGEKHFRDLEQLSLKEILRLQDFVLACGGGTPCFYQNMEIMNNSGETFYIKMNQKALTVRLANAKKVRPLLMGVTQDEMPDKISEILEKREVFYNQAKHIVDGVNLKVDDILRLL
jgi:shikimate kinase